MKTNTICFVGVKLVKRNWPTKIIQPFINVNENSFFSNFYVTIIDIGYGVNIFQKN